MQDVESDLVYARDANINTPFEPVEMELAIPSRGIPRLGFCYAPYGTAVKALARDMVEKKSQIELAEELIRCVQIVGSEWAGTDFPRLKWGN
jgi:hypothetical protein